MDIINGVNAFYFNDEPSLNKQVNPVTAIEFNFFKY